MTANARDWGVTILRLWFGFVAAYAGYRAASDQAAAYGLAGLLGLWRLPLADLAFHASIFVKLAGGAAVFLGVAVRLAALLVAAAAAFDLWRAGPPGLGLFLYDRETVSILIACVAFLLMGAGRMNLGAFLGRK